MHIEAGKFKGRKLLPPPGKAITRPLTGSVKKSLFSTIAPWLEDAVVIDLYCGTGTMGLESLSRGAAFSYFAEYDKAVIQRLRRNIQDIGASEDSKIWAGDITVKLHKWLDLLDKKVDLAFVDPPYVHVRKWDWAEVERKIFQPINEHLSNDGLVVLRTPSEVEIPDTLGGLIKKRQKKYGQMLVAYFQHKEISEATA